jgi:hypothetical protein
MSDSEVKFMEMCQITQMYKKFGAKMKGNFFLFQHQIIMFTYRLLISFTPSDKFHLKPYFNPSFDKYYERCGHFVCVLSFQFQQLMPMPLSYKV